MQNGRSITKGHHEQTREIHSTSSGLSTQSSKRTSTCIC